MIKYAVAYGGTAIVLLALDAVWLTLAAKPVYRAQIGPLLLDNPNLAIAGLFYLFYAVGLTVFCVMPAASAKSWMMAVWLGALLGFVAYGTYDITNLATLKGWTVTVSVIDLTWGTFVSAVAATAGYFAVRAVFTD
jgi:uncharacterized membrane protein